MNKSTKDGETITPGRKVVMGRHTKLKSGGTSYPWLTTLSTTPNGSYLATVVATNQKSEYSLAGSLLPGLTKLQAKCLSALSSHPKI